MDITICSGWGVSDLGVKRARISRENVLASIPDNEGSRTGVLTILTSTAVTTVSGAGKARAVKLEAS